MTDEHQEGALISSLRRGPDVMRLVAGFAAALPSLYAEIDAALASGDLRRVTDLAHRLKGSAGGYGFSLIMTAAAGLEELAGRDALEDCRLAAARLRDLIGRVRVESPAQRGTS